jgi:formylmethanofuran dehydrogenase subunit B
MKKKSRQSNEDSPMAVDLFEREYADEITWQVEVLLEDGEFKESEYDEAYEQAIELVAEDKGIELI